MRKILWLSFQINKKILIFLLLVTGLLAGCLNIPTDDYRENLTLDEAQGLVSFPICFPGYIPPEIDSTPKIIYLNDAANVPEERYIRLEYKGKADQKRVFEVYQRFTNDEGMKTQYPDTMLENLQQGAKAGLLDWIFHPRFLPDTEIKDLMKQTQIEARVYQTNQTVWWLYEIVSPSEYHSTMTKWFVNHVEYWIYSLLPVDEIVKVTESMMKCANH